MSILTIGPESDDKKDVIKLDFKRLNSASELILLLKFMKPDIVTTKKHVHVITKEWSAVEKKKLLSLFHRARS